MPRPGLRAHDFGRMPADMLAQTLSAFRPSCIQLAITKALPKIAASSGDASSGDASSGGAGSGSVDPATARSIARAFAAQNIGIAVLGCYINPIHPDQAIRESQLVRFEEHLRRARDFGCSIVGTETGSLNPDCSWHPDTQGDAAFDTLCRSVERLVRVAESNGCMVGIEPVAGQHTVSSMEKTKRLLDRIDSKALGIIYDPVNLVPDSGLGESWESFFTRAAQAFGDRIVAVHVKDCTFTAGRKSGAMPAGTGELDYPALFRMLEKTAPFAPVILENASPSTAPAAMDFIEALWSRYT